MDAPKKFDEWREEGDLLTYNMGGTHSPPLTTRRFSTSHEIRNRYNPSFHQVLGTKLETKKKQQDYLRTLLGKIEVQSVLWIV